MSEGEEELNVGAVRLEEVASAANVSLSTASKALRGKPHVSEKTRIRVIDAARRLGYSAAEAMASMARLSVRDSVVPEFLRTLVFARPRGDDQFADCTFSPSLDMSR
jgi:transcriptional regulator with XRE-family HTH domain